ncbi:MAG: RNA polymerase sigma factor [Acidimicrobiia bacterium]|nr:MAG: RNA polymerase sigma factor [Acidimicrobiia bacterium]
MAPRRNSAATSVDSRFSALFERHYDDVLGYCVRRIDMASAEDAASDVFVVAWRRIDQLEWDTARPWLYGIARGVLANRRRSAGRRDRLTRKMSGLAHDAEEAAEVVVIRRERDEQVMAALGVLKESDREILLLSTWEELTAPEIATALGISVAAAEQRLHRAKQRFAKHLDRIPENAHLSPRAAQEGEER